MKDESENSDAIHFVKTWQKHRLDLARNPLIYLDTLMEAFATASPMTPAELEKELPSMVPSLQLGTARRLVGLKYNAWPSDLKIVASRPPEAKRKAS